MGAENQERYVEALNTAAKSRAENKPLSRIARELGVDPKVVQQWVPSAFRKDRRGRIMATTRDSYLRVLTIPGPQGTREVAVKDSRTASQLAKYSDAVRSYVRRGDPSPLRQFSDLVLKDANGRRIKLVTDLRLLNELGHAGVLSFESLYVRSA